MARHFGSVKTFPLDLIRKSVEPRSGSAPERAFLPAPGFKNSSEYPFRQGGFGCWLERVSGFGFRVSGFGFRVSGLGFRVSGFGFVGASPAGDGFGGLFH